MDEATANAVECLVNLLYLIRMQAAVPTDVLHFVDMAQGPMETLVDAARGGEPGEARWMTQGSSPEGPGRSG